MEIEAIILPGIFNIEDTNNKNETRFYLGCSKLKKYLHNYFTEVEIFLPESLNFDSKVMDSDGLRFTFTEGKRLGKQVFEGNTKINLFINRKGEISFELLKWSWGVHTGCFEKFSIHTPENWVIMSEEDLKNYSRIAELQRKMKEENFFISISEFAFLLKQITNIFKNRH